MSADLQRWMNRGVDGNPPPTTLGEMSQTAKELQERAARQMGVGPGVGELAARELAALSGGAVQVSPAMLEAQVSHA